MKLPDDIGGFPTETKEIKLENRFVINDEKVLLQEEIAFLKGKISVYEKFLKDKGYIKEEE